MRRVVLVLLGCCAIAGALAAVSSGHATARRVLASHAHATAIPGSLLKLIERKIHPSAAPRRECSFATGVCGCTIPVAARSAASSPPGGECPPSRSGPCMEYVMGAETVRTTIAPPVALCRPLQLMRQLHSSPPANKSQPRH